MQLSQPLLLFGGLFAAVTAIPTSTDDPNVILAPLIEHGKDGIPGSYIAQLHSNQSVEDHLQRIGLAGVTLDQFRYYGIIRGYHFFGNKETLTTIRADPGVNIVEQSTLVHLNI